jgi:HTH-type transcriptional regulator/antitoxin HigA
MEAMSSALEDLDLKRYGRLLARAVPKVIKTEEENERALAIVESLMAKGEANLTLEEDALLELLADLVHDFEERAYPIPRSEPHEMVAFLLEQRGLTAKNLWPVVGSKSRVSEILAGKRAMTKEQAKKLAAFFRTSVELFI